jgi:hypothetical protein
MAADPLQQFLDQRAWSQFFNTAEAVTAGMCAAWVIRWTVVQFGGRVFRALGGAADSAKARVGEENKPRTPSPDQRALEALRRRP